MPSNSWSFVAERFGELATNYWRAGGRFAPTPGVTVDLSHCPRRQRIGALALGGRSDVDLRLLSRNAGRVSYTL